MVLRLREFKDRQFKGFKGLFEKYRCSKAIYINLDFFYFEMVLRLRDRQFKGFKGLFEKYRCSKAIYINLDFFIFKWSCISRSLKGCSKSIVAPKQFILI